VTIDGRDLAAMLEHSHQYLDFRLAAATDEDLTRRIPGATITSPAHIYVHAAMTEDEAISRSMGKEPLRMEAPYAAALPPAVAVTPEWDNAGFFDPTVHRYVAAVRARGVSWLLELSADAAARLVPFHRLVQRGGRWEVESRDIALHFFLNDNIIMHTFEHAGEIAALRGVVGGDGIPVGAPVWSPP